MLVDIKKRWVDFLVPRRCFVCQGDILNDVICQACDSLCNVCPSFNLGPRCNDYGAIFYYELAIKEIIRAAKFGQSIGHAHLLLALIEQELAGSNIIDRSREFAPEAVTFVPLHWAKKIGRSVYLPYLFARLLGKKLNIPVLSMLKKTYQSSPQSAISRRTQRAEAVKGAFYLNKKTANPSRVILVDDILTTGATFDESRKMIQSLGVDLRCIAMAKTP